MSKKPTGMLPRLANRFWCWLWRGHRFNWIDDTGCCEYCKKIIPGPLP